MAQTETEQVEFTPESFKLFKDAYQKAENAEDEMFTFDGRQYVTNYAKYLIEYLAPKFE